MLAWDDTMTTGIPSIDAQHQEIIDKFNQFSEILSNGSSFAEQREAAGEVLDYLQFYAAWHFKREEDAFEEFDCPVAEINKQAHVHFIEMFGDFYDRWWKEGMNAELAQETFGELAKWIVEHIVQIDSQAHHYIAGLDQ